MEPRSQATTGKKEQVRSMFDNIASRYDLLNSLLSLGIYKHWRRRLVEATRPLPDNAKILDVATGTGDIAIALAKLNPASVVGIDISERMLELGKKKVKDLGYDQRVSLQPGDAEDIRFPDNEFDAATVAYGVRNFENLEKGLREMLRVLKPGGKLVILEFMKPRNTLFAGLFRFYFTQVLPRIGGAVSANKQAYSYLPESVESFPQGTALVKIIEQQGFAQAQCKELTNGVVGLYTACKPV